MGKKSRVTRGDYETGYGRPPKSGQIKPGEVRNPWGKNGKPKPTEDLFLKVAAAEIAANVNGRTTSMSLEEGAIRTAFQEALKGNPTALKLVLEHLTRRRLPLPPVPTPEELAQQAAEEAERQRLSKYLVEKLEEMARVKKQGAPRVRFGADGQPIIEGEGETSSAGPVDQPIKKTGW